MEIADQEASVDAYRHPAEILDENQRAELVAQLAEALTPVFLFLSKGRLTDTMEMRTWVVLYETRLDLIGGETIGAYAKRVGVSANRIHTLVKEFRALVPAYRSANRKPAATIARMSETAKRNAATHPRGRKPLS